MNKQHNYPSFELSPFCTNDQVYSSSATNNADLDLLYKDSHHQHLHHQHLHHQHLHHQHLHHQHLHHYDSHQHDLPGHGDLMESLHHTDTEWPVTLIVIGLSRFKTDHIVVDEHISNIGSLGIAAKLQQCIRHCYEADHTDDTKAATDDHIADLYTQHTVKADKSQRRAELYRLTSHQFAALTVAPAARLADLCESLLSTLDQPLYVGNQPLRTTAHLGIARGQQYHGRPESCLRAAQSALFNSRQRYADFRRLKKQRL